MRKAYSIFTDPATVVTEEELGSGILAVNFDDGNGGRALVVINPHAQALPYALDGEWNLVADASKAGADVFARENGNITADAIGVRVYVNDALVK